jgi:hypothetical protein
MVFFHGITYRKLIAKNRPTINSSPPEKVEKWKNEYVTEYVVEHVP